MVRTGVVAMARGINPPLPAGTWNGSKSHAQVEMMAK